MFWKCIKQFSFLLYFCLMGFIQLSEYTAEKRGYQDYEYPMISVIIPTYNCSEKITLTLQSVLTQNYPHFELIVIDGNSTDHTFEILENFKDERVRLYKMAEYGRYEMLNKGISHAVGDYISFLFPGDYFIHPNVFSRMMHCALENHLPELVYSGSLIRDGKKTPKILFRPFSLPVLKKGLQPTSLQSCWWKKSALVALGKFDVRLEMRGGFDLMCRFLKKKTFLFASISHVLTDYDLRFVSKSMVLKHFQETWVVLFRQFGLWVAVRWLFIQKDSTRIFYIWGRNIKRAFFGQ